MRAWARCIAIVSLAALLGACGSSVGKQGADLYEQSCAGCHGAAGEGRTGPALGPGSNAEQLTDDQIASVIRVGPGAMPGFPRLSDEQVASLVAYVRALQRGEAP